MLSVDIKMCLSFGPVPPLGDAVVKTWEEREEEQYH